MECFRIDESGYTGFDLLNSDQRLQGASAIAISNEDAEHLIRDHFPKLQARELKFGALARRPPNHPRLVALQRDLLEHFPCVTFICDKRFLLALMFVDFAIEPFYHAQGHDLYADGRNHAIASLLQMIGPTLLGEEPFAAMMAAFQQAMKLKTPEALASLVMAARSTDWVQMEEELGPIVHAAPQCMQAIATEGVSTDAAFTLLQGLITRMEGMTTGPYRVEHDQSKNLLTYNRLIKALIDHKQPATFRHSEIASMTFPLKLTEVMQVESHTSPAVQLADILVGAALEAVNARCLKRPARLDPDVVLGLYRDDQIIHLLPSLDFDEQQRFRQGSKASQAIDYIAAHIIRQ